MTQTPAQAAKEYAALHGFTITPCGRRYTISHKATVRGVTELWANDVGGYPAMLNAMKARVEETLECVMVDGKYIAQPVECVASGEACSYAADGPNGEMQCRYCGDAREQDTIRASDVMFAQTNATYGKLAMPADAIPDNVKVYALHTPDGQAEFEKDFGPSPVEKFFDAPPVPVHSLQLDRYAEHVHAQLADPAPGATTFDDFDAQAQARIRKAANRIAKQRRKASGKPPGGPWHVIFNGMTVMTYGYPSRADALAVVRWGFNQPGARIPNNWRTASVTVEYRAS